MTEPVQPAKVLVELIVLAFSKSEVANVVGTDALRMVVQGDIRHMLAGDKLDLEPLWELLCGQPGFEPELGLPAVCKLRTWEPYMGVSLELPSILDALDAGAIASLAEQVEVSPDELAAIVGKRPAPPTAQPGASPPAAVPESGSAPRGKRSSLANERPQRTTMTVDAPDSPRSLSARLAGLVPVLGIVAVAAFAFAGYSVYGYACGGPELISLETSLEGVPVTDLRQLGSRVGGVLSDEGWLDEPEEQREEQLRAALAELGDSVDGVLLFGADRKLRASATRRASDGQIIYYFAR